MVDGACGSVDDSGLDNSVVVSVSLSGAMVVVAWSVVVTVSVVLAISVVVTTVVVMGIAVVVIVAVSSSSLGSTVVVTLASGSS